MMHVRAALCAGSMVAFGCGKLDDSTATSSSSAQTWTVADLGDAPEATELPAPLPTPPGGNCSREQFQAILNRCAQEGGGLLTVADLDCLKRWGVETPAVLCKRSRGPYPAYVVECTNGPKPEEIFFEVRPCQYDDPNR